MWALGWHQCRWGYKDKAALQAVLDGYEKDSLPLDTLWSDIDYMDRYRDFTYNTKEFEGLPDFIKDKLHAKHMHYIPIVDAGIA